MRYQPKSQSFAKSVITPVTPKRARHPLPHFVRVGGIGLQFSVQTQTSLSFLRRDAAAAAERFKSPPVGDDVCRTLRLLPAVTERATTARNNKKDPKLSLRVLHTIFLAQP